VQRQVRAVILDRIDGEEHRGTGGDQAPGFAVGLLEQLDHAATMPRRAAGSSQSG
jgi:hypothetical protein